MEAEMPPPPSHSNTLSCPKCRALRSTHILSFQHLWSPCIPPSSSSRQQMWELHFLRQSCHRLGPSPPLPEEASSAGYWTRVFPDSWCWWRVENRVTTYLRDNQDSYGQTPWYVRTFKQPPAWFCWLTCILV